MKEIAKVEILTICAWQLGALMAILVAFVILYLKANRTETLNAFFSILAAIGLWLTGKIFKTVAPTIELRWSFIVIYYFAICWLEVALLEFGYTYNKGRNMVTKKRLLLYILPTIQFFIVATNPLHHLFYSEFTFFSDQFGPLFYIHIVIEYIYIFAGIILCRNKLKQQLKYRSTGYKFLISFAMLAPIVLHLLYISRILEDLFDRINLKVIFDVTPIVFTWSALLFVYAAFKYEFFEITPVLKHKIVQNLDKPVCIIDKFADVLFVNEQLAKWLDDVNGHNDFLDFLKRRRADITKEEFRSAIEEPFRMNDNVYMYYSRKIKDLEGVKYIVIFNDITASIRAKEKLVSNNRKLQKINEELSEQIKLIENYSKIYARKFVARELHDIIGHSLVLSMKLLEVAKLSKGNKEKALESLEKAKECMEQGIEDMKTINEDGDISETGHHLKDTIAGIIRRIQDLGVEVSFYFNGEQYRLDFTVFEVVRNVITELTTNVLKHSKASKLLLSVNLDKNQISVTCMDNGIGVDEIVPGNGLNGIVNRLKAVNGKIEFTSERNEGFVSNLAISF
jgi:signal transduction histidine kinase